MADCAKAPASSPAVESIFRRLSDTALIDLTTSTAGPDWFGVSFKDFECEKSIRRLDDTLANGSGQRAAIRRLDLFQFSSVSENSGGVPTTLDIGSLREGRPMFVFTSLRHKTARPGGECTSRDFCESASYSSSLMSLGKTGSLAQIGIDFGFASHGVPKGGRSNVSDAFPRLVFPDRRAASSRSISDFFKPSILPERHPGQQGPA